MRNIILAIALIFLVSSAHAEPNKKRTALINKHLLTLTQTGYTIDSVLQLLTSMENAQQANLDDLVSNWNDAAQTLQANIQTIQGLDDQQHASCDAIDATIAALQNEQTKYQQYISQAQDTLENNANVLATRLDSRCSANLVYVSKLKDNQDAIRLLQFLSQSIASPAFADYVSGSDTAFAELKEHMQGKRRHGLQALAKHHMIAMIQQSNYNPSTYQGEASSSFDFTLEARTSGEIGTGQIDNSRTGLELSSFQQDSRGIGDFIAELGGFVDELISQLQQNSADLASAEFAAVEDLINYQDQIEQDAIVLNEYINSWGNHIDNLATTIEGDQQASADCHSRADDLDQELSDAENDYNEKLEAFQDKQTSLENTVAALQQIIELYTDQVVDPAANYESDFQAEISKEASHAQSLVSSDISSNVASVSYQSASASASDSNDESVSLSAHGSHSSLSDDEGAYQAVAETMLAQKRHMKH